MPTQEVGQRDVRDADGERDLGHLDGWGSMRALDARHPLYPSLGARGQRALGVWTLRGAGVVRVRWRSSRAGSGWSSIEVG